MKCSRCDLNATIKQGNQHLCDKHYRFGQMRSKAKKSCKEVPSHTRLNEMVSDHMLCPDCGVKMNWRAKDGRSTVASLQHYRDGSLSIVCLSCNSRHASMEGDSYRDMPKDHKRCPSCKTIKHESEFSADNGRTGRIKRKSICKLCSNEKVKQWRGIKRDEYNAYQRAYREKRKADGDPITRRS